MPVQLLSSDAEKVVLQLEVNLSGSMLEREEQIQKALNETGMVVTAEALRYFDTDGSPLLIGATKWTSKGQEPKDYQSPYGEVRVARHLYQTAQGGATFCPLDHNARILTSSTPRFAQQVASKYAHMPVTQVLEDLSHNHGRKVASSFVQDVSSAVGSIVQAKEEDWHYAPPKLDAEVATVAVGMDGTCMLTCQDGYREAMVGNVSLYDAQGERLHTVYVGATPEYGKATFKARLAREIDQAKQHYPEARVIGIADGAAENWRFLEAHTQVQVLDFYHASEYVSAVARTVFPNPDERKSWLQERLHHLKHEAGAASDLIADMEALQQRPRLSADAKDALATGLTYFNNHKHQMGYVDYKKAGWPIGSGVTEAACKTLVKQRLCRSGMRWKEHGAAVVLSLRSLILTPGRWKQFWAKINQYGFSALA